jgi:NTE family protein
MDRRPAWCDHVALVLQSGGALGAYQAGVYQALQEAGLQPDWIAGTSIGSVTGAIIAGNRPEHRLDRLHDFWTTVTARPGALIPPRFGGARKAADIGAALLTLALGQPGLFAPAIPNFLSIALGAPLPTSLYDSAPLRETLSRLVDFGLLNRGDTRYAAGAVDIETGRTAWFDSATTEILPEHVMASAATPPGLPMVRIGDAFYWDGGLGASTPLQHVLDQAGGTSMLALQVDAFGAGGSLPRDLWDVLSRQTDIQQAGRTGLATEGALDSIRQARLLHAALAKIPPASLTDAERALQRRLAAAPRVVLFTLIYQQNAYDRQAKGYEFTASAMREHWDAGHRDTARALRNEDWLADPAAAGGVAVHDVHGIEG